MPKIQVNDIEMYYELHGQGQPLILISGYTADTLAWSLVFETLSKHFQVLMLDNRGAGESAAPNKPYTVEMMADDTMALAEVLKLKNPHVLGNSMGGAIVQAIGKYHGDKVNKLVISNSSSHFNNQFMIACEDHLRIFEKNHDLVEQFKLALPWLFASKFLSNKETIEQLMELTKNHPKPQSVVGRVNQFNALATFDSREWLKDIQNETLIITGDEDIICLAKESHFMNAQIPNSKLQMFEDCGHLPMVECPSMLTSTVLAYLSQ